MRVIHPPIRSLTDIPDPERFAQKVWARVSKGEGCWLWTGAKLPGGRGIVTISKKSGVVMRIYAPRAIYLLTHGTLDPALDAAHCCDNPNCVNPDHLFLTSPAGNTADMLAKGRHCKGTAHPRHRLTEQQVCEIRERSLNGEADRALAQAFNVSPMTINRIVNGKTWRHVPHDAGARAQRTAPLPRATLTPQQVREIRALSSTLSQSAIARLYGVQPAAINRIIHGTRWKNT